MYRAELFLNCELSGAFAMKYNGPGFRLPQDDAASRTPETRKKRKARKQGTVAIIEYYFNKKIIIVKDGAEVSMTGFEAIMRQLVNQEFKGNKKATKVRIQYTKFASMKNPAGQEIKVNWEYADLNLERPEYGYDD